jgi:hypothetical protein
MLPSPAAVGTALRSVSCGVASSVKSVRRAHASHALCWPASETVIGAVSVPRVTRSLRLHPAESSRVRVRAFPLRFSASASRLGSHRHPPPPNNSFKPTPCRGVGHVLYATLAHVRRPATGRLNSSVRRQKNIRFQPPFACSAAPLIFAPFPSLAAALAVFSSHAMLRIVRLARSKFACVAFARYGNSGCCGICSETDTVASETPG